jgi:hypothetical protein
MLGKFTREDESDTSKFFRTEEMRQGWGNIRCLDLSGRDCGLLVVCGKLGGFRCNALKDV